MRPRSKLSQKIAQPCQAVTPEKAATQAMASASVQRRAAAGRRATSASTAMCRRASSAQAIDSSTPQIRQSWLSSAAQMVGAVNR